LMGVGGVWLCVVLVGVIGRWGVLLGVGWR